MTKFIASLAFKDYLPFGALIISRKIPSSILLSSLDLDLLLFAYFPMVLTLLDKEGQTLNALKEVPTLGKSLLYFKLKSIGSNLPRRVSLVKFQCKVSLTQSSMLST